MFAGSSCTQTISRALGWRAISARSSFLRKRVELVEKQDGRIGIAAAFAFPAQFVADFSAANQDALRRT